MNFPNSNNVVKRMINKYVQNRLPGLATSEEEGSLCKIDLQWTCHQLSRGGVLASNVQHWFYNKMSVSTPLDTLPMHIWRGDI